MTTQSPKNPAGKNRRPYLDTFRAIACLLVFFYHSALNIQVGKVIFFGYNGVHLFFVLSGYLLGGKIVEKLSAGNELRTSIDYFKHRFFRIYPAYLFCLCVFVLLRFVSGTNPPNISNILARVGLYFNYLDSTDLFAIHAALWTLAIEIQFYVVLPIAAFLVLRFIKDWKYATIALGVLFVIVGVFSRAYEIVYVSHWYPSVAIVRFKWVISYLDLFGIGILLDCAERAWRARFGSLNLRVAIIGCLAALLVLTGVSIWARMAGNDWQNAHDAKFMVGAPVLTCGAFAVLLGCTGLSKLQDLSIFRWGWLQWIGKISYSIYLYHIGVLFAANTLIKPLERGWSWTTTCVSMALISLPFVLVIAWLSYTLVEVPFMQRNPLAEYRAMFERLMQHIRGPRGPRCQHS